VPGNGRDGIRDGPGSTLMVRVRPTCDDGRTMSDGPALEHAARRAARSADDRLLGGVASGLSAHLGIPLTYVRVFFLVAACIGGMGLMLYAGLWMTMPMDTRQVVAAPGLEAASRQGRRPRPQRRLQDMGPVVALGAIALGVAVLASVLAGGPVWFWPVLVAILGVAVLWRQADEAQRERWVDSTGRVDLVRAIVGGGGRAAYARIAVGLGLLLAALVLFGVQTGQASVAQDVVLAGVLGIAGIGLTLGPWLFRLAGDLTEERAARVRQQERADVAAHLHDSVLQTLALIQKHAGDGRAVATLARAQERDLRQWLYGDQEAATLTIGAMLRGAAAEVEDGFGTPVEVVVVGDAKSSDRATALVNAAREAMVNGAKHSGAAKIDVYAELSPARAEVFVRDRGAGFVLDDVGRDRLGVRNSIVGRMDRHGGSSSIRTAPGEGTEVQLAMNLEEQP
jgi:signal transduction histidine kinase/phage shock protein PspC (stress-responsive transcriptional regulator)